MCSCNPSIWLVEAEEHKLRLKVNKQELGPYLLGEGAPQWQNICSAQKKMRLLGEPEAPSLGLSTVTSLTHKSDITEVPQSLLSRATGHSRPVPAICVPLQAWSWNTRTWDICPLQG